MKLLKNFLADLRLFSIIYITAMAALILFYSMTSDGDEYVYPIFLALFFYVIYFIISLMSYLHNANNVTRLRKNLVTVNTHSKEFEDVYSAFGEVYTRYNEELSRIEQKAVDDKRFMLSFVHNLKTPVTVSSLIIQRTENGELSGEDAISGIKSELNRLTIDLNMLLDLKRLEEIQNDYMPEAALLSDEITGIINSNKSLFINSHVYPKYDSEKVYVYTDPKWNRILINQIISNAVKYSKCDETRYIYFNTFTDGDWTSLVIKDEGIGIPDYDISRVFDPFFTGDNGRKGYNSSGVGLYLCKQICDRLGHKIKIENDNGCKVTISYLSKL